MNNNLFRRVKQRKKYADVNTVVCDVADIKLGCACLSYVIPEYIV